MRTYVIRMFGRKFEVRADTPLRLRRECRRFLGWRFSVRCTYKQIGCNSYYVLYRGIVIQQVYLKEG